MEGFVASFLLSTSPLATAWTNHVERSDVVPWSPLAALIRMSGVILTPFTPTSSISLMAAVELGPMTSACAR